MRGFLVISLSLALVYLGWMDDTPDNDELRLLIRQLFFVFSVVVIVW